MKQTIFKSKKGAMSLGDMPGLALTFLLAGVFFAVALVILAALQSNSLVGNASVSTTANATIVKTITAVAEIPNNWLLLIAVIVAAAVVIGIVISNLGGQTGR